MDWAVNEFSVSGSPVLHVFDTFLRMGIEVRAVAATAAYTKTASTAKSISQRVVNNSIATTKSAIATYGTFIAKAPDQYDVANWATITKEGSFNFGTAKKMEPIVAISSTATGMNFLVLYSAPETYGSSYIGSTFTSALSNTATSAAATSAIATI